MKVMAAKFANAVLTSVAKKLVKTNCVFICHRPEAPDELFQK
ncbi:MAG: cyclic lactone autoinducer peptide [Candidatus Pristimantibacillus sp.]